MESAAKKTNAKSTARRVLTMLVGIATSVSAQATDPSIALRVDDAMRRARLR